MKKQTKLYLTQKVNIKLQLFLLIFIEDKERSTRLGERDLGVLSRLFLSYSASLVSAKEVVKDM